jgi:hypothetical protein
LIFKRNPHSPSGAINHLNQLPFFQIGKGVTADFPFRMVWMDSIWESGTGAGPCSFPRILTTLEFSGFPADGRDPKARAQIDIRGRGPSESFSSGLSGGSIPPSGAERNESAFLPDAAKQLLHGGFSVQTIPVCLILFHGKYIFSRVGWVMPFSVPPPPYPKFNPGVRQESLRFRLLA